MSNHSITVFIHAIDGLPYIRVIPSKRLFNSTMVHEVVNRGDFFALCLTNSILTILPQGADSNDIQSHTNEKQSRVKKQPDFNEDLFKSGI
jgi:hypothetical protein